MLTEEIRNRINDIKDAMSDNETAHILEESLYIDFIKAIANEEYNSIQDLVNDAKLVSSVTNLNYTRWYA